MSRDSSHEQGFGAPAGALVIAHKAHKIACSIPHDWAADSAESSKDQFTDVAVGNRIFGTRIEHFGNKLIFQNVNAAAMGRTLARDRPRFGEPITVKSLGIPERLKFVMHGE